MRLLKNEKGFTLAETLMAVLILMMVTAIVAGGLPAAQAALKKTVDASHAQTLLSTTMTALRDELSTAKSITEANNTTIKYEDAAGLKSEISVGINGRIYLKKNLGLADGESASGGVIDRLLISRQASTSDLYSTYTDVSYEDGIVSIKGLAVYNGDRLFSSLFEDPEEVYKIRVIGEWEAEGGD